MPTLYGLGASQECPLRAHPVRGREPPSAEAIALCGDALFKLVFVTSTLHTGDLKTAGAGATGLEGADNICNLRAQEGGLPGKYTAWLSDSTTDAKDRVTQAVIPYRRTDLAVVADDFADLTNCGNPECLQVPIHLDQFAVGPLNEIVWTGTGSDGIGRPPFLLCDDWTSGIDAHVGVIGVTSATDFRWTDVSDVDCDEAFRFHCFQD